MVEFEEGDEFGTASAGGEERNRELMFDGRDKRGTEFGGEFKSEGSWKGRKSLGPK